MTDKLWYKTWFSSPDYLELYKHRDSKDAKRIISLFFKHIRLKRYSNILDLACGGGRHSILFAKKGFNVTGIDLSKYLINQAKQKLKGEFSKYKDLLHFEIKDMRDIQHISEFDLVVNLFTSFGYFTKHTDNEKVINAVSKALKQGGYFLFDFLNSDYLKKHLVPFDTKKFDGKTAIQVRTIKRDIVTKEIYILYKRLPKHYYPGITHFTESIKLYNFLQINDMFKKYGLLTIKKFGDYDGSVFKEKNSKRLIVIARKTE